jgi:uncharacterized protein (UPF0548 family)
MLVSHKPDAKAVERFLDRQQNQPFSYPEVGSTRGPAPSGYNVDHNRICLGKGLEAFDRAIEGIKTWRMFGTDWTEIFPRDAPIEDGSTVAILVRHLGFWSLNASRIVYVIEDHDEVKRFGFAYGTLPDHAEQGEERFSVEYQPADGSVWYDLFAFSRPRHILARLGYPFSRRLQRRFARDSLKAMEQAVNYEGSGSRS